MGPRQEHGPTVICIFSGRHWQLHITSPCAVLTITFSSQHTSLLNQCKMPKSDDIIFFCSCMIASRCLPSQKLKDRAREEPRTDGQRETTRDRPKRTVDRLCCCERVSASACCGTSVGKAEQSQTPRFSSCTLHAVERLSRVTFGIVEPKPKLPHKKALCAQEQTH